MGIFLARDLGRSYVNFALTAYDIAIDWPGVGCGPPSRLRLDGSVEQRLHALGGQALLVDLAVPGDLRSPYLPPGEYFGSATSGATRGSSTTASSTWRSRPR